MDTRRAEQNRAAQRAFRRRKEQHVKELEDKVRGYVQLQKRLHDLENDNDRLRHRLWELEGGPLPLPHTTALLHDPSIPQPPPPPSSTHPHILSESVPLICVKEQEQHEKVLDDLAVLLRTHRRPPI